jgi:hypothetical protein
MAEGLDLSAITRLVNGGRDQYNATRQAINMPTAGEQLSGSLVEATKDIPQNTLAGGFVKGLSGGYDMAEKRKGATKRERMAEYLMAQEEYANKQQQYVEETAAKIQRMKLADEEARANGKVLADSLQSLELGDESGFRNFLAANPNVATLLGDDGPDGIMPEGGRIVTRNGAKFVQAYGKGASGEPWAGQEVPLDSILSRYAPDVLSARSAQALTDAQSQAELQKTQAATLKSLADAGVSAPVDQGIIPTGTAAPQVAPQATSQTPQQGAGTVASLVKAPTLTTKPKVAAIKPLSNTMQKVVDEKKTILTQAAGTNSDLQSLVGLIDQGKLATDPLSRIGGTLANSVGMSTENSRNLSALESKLNGARNAILLLNKGVQTDGDADRAMNEIIAGAAKNDTQLVKQRLNDLVTLNNRAIKATQAQIGDIYKENGGTPPDLAQYTEQPAAVNSGGQSLQANPQAAQIRAAFKAGQITREQARAQLQALGAQ